MQLFNTDCTKGIVLFNKIDIQLSKLQSNRYYIHIGKKCTSIAIFKLHISIWIY